MNTEAVIAEYAQLLSLNNLTAKEVHRLFSLAENKLDLFGELEEEYELTLGHIIHQLIKQNDSPEDLIELITTFHEFIDINHPNSIGQTILHVVAAGSGNQELFELILNDELKFKTEVDLYAVSKDGKMPAEVAVTEKNTFMTEKLAQDFTKKVILVSSLVPNSIANALLTAMPETACDVLFSSVGNSEDENHGTNNAVVKTQLFITDDGTIASHLNFSENVYSKSFIDRPHSHWSWDGLIQGNSGGDWEEAGIAYLEPMSEVASLLGVAPYDTTAVGSHTLSKQSIILLPDDKVQALSERLINYQGKIVGYNPSIPLRSAINTALDEYYPKRFKLTNKHNTPLNTIKHNLPTDHANDYNALHGYFNKVYVQPGANPETRRELMHERNVAVDSTFKKITDKRYVGLHLNSTTDIEKNQIFITLKEASEAPKNNLFKNKGHFIGVSGSKAKQTLCVYEAYKTASELKVKYSPSTGAHDYADYLIKKALIADLRSIHVETGNATLETLTDKQLEEMVEVILPNFDSLLIKIKNDAPNGISEYRETLKEQYTVMLSVQTSTAPNPTSEVTPRPPNLQQLLAAEMAAGRALREDVAPEEAASAGVRSGSGSGSN